MNPRDWYRYAAFLFLLTLGWFGSSAFAEASPDQAKGPYSGISPLVRIYSEGSGTASTGINAEARPEKGSLQTNNIEIHYLWQPTDNLSVAKIQFHSSAPGKAYVRLYEAEAGKPGKLLAQAGFKSLEYGWQGDAFAQPVQVNGGKEYFVSYVHEKDIKDYVTWEEGREAVTFYWNDYDFRQAIQEPVPLQAPVLTRVKAYGSQIKIEWLEAQGNDDQLIYVIYRNGVEVGRTYDLYYIDDLGSLPEQGMFAYTVRSADSGKSMSPFSNSLDVTFGEVELPVPTIPAPQPEIPAGGGGATTTPVGTVPIEPTTPSPKPAPNEQPTPPSTEPQPDGGGSVIPEPEPNEEPTTPSIDSQPGGGGSASPEPEPNEEPTTPSTEPQPDLEGESETPEPEPNEQPTTPSIDSQPSEVKDLVIPEPKTVELPMVPSVESQPEVKGEPMAPSTEPQPDRAEEPASATAQSAEPSSNQSTAAIPDVSEQPKPAGQQPVPSAPSPVSTTSGTSQTAESRSTSTTNANMASLSSAAANGRPKEEG